MALLGTLPSWCRQAPSIVSVRTGRSWAWGSQPGCEGGGSQGAVNICCPAHTPSIQPGQRARILQGMGKLPAASEVLLGAGRWGGGVSGFVSEKLTQNQWEAQSGCPDAESAFQQEAEDSVPSRGFGGLLAENLGISLRERPHPL